MTLTKTLLACWGWQVAVRSQDKKDGERVATAGGPLFGAEHHGENDDDDYNNDDEYMNDDDDDHNDDDDDRDERYVGQRSTTGGGKGFYYFSPSCLKTNSTNFLFIVGKCTTVFFSLRVWFSFKLQLTC